jgi:type IV pilus assembly protein PilQ
MPRRLLPTIIAALACCLVTSPALAQDAPPPADPETDQRPAEELPESVREGVEVSEYLTVDIFVQDEDITNVLRMLSLQSQRNIVASRDVTGTVTANLYGVTFQEALDAILNVNGYGAIEQGNFIYVYPVEEIERILAEQRQIVVKVIQLNYLNATDAAAFVEPLLSPDGRIQANGDVGDFALPDEFPTGNEEFALAATLVIYDYEEHIAEIEALLDQLDTRPAQVLVEATILETSLTEDNAFGVDFALVADVEFSDFVDLGGPLTAANTLRDANPSPDGRAGAVSGTPGAIVDRANFRAGITWNDVSVFVSALDEVTDTTILSNPKILALNRQPARVLVGERLGFLSTTASETSTTQTVEFLDTGTQLSFRPFVSKDGMIRMELSPRVSTGQPRPVTDATGVTVTIPDEVTQEITTNVMVPDGATIVLGGLFRESTTLARSQVPFLGDIPLVGAAFRGHDDSIDRSEIIFLIKPSIVNDRALIEQADRALAYIERVRTGSRRGLLPFSRERQMSMLNVQAERWAKKGEWDKAMWALRRSLELAPQQAAAYELRERLFGVTELWPRRGVLDYAFEEQFDAVLPPHDWHRKVPMPDAPQREVRVPDALKEPALASPAAEADTPTASLDELLDRSFNIDGWQPGKQDGMQPIPFTMLGFPEPIVVSEPEQPALVDVPVDND